LAEVIGGESRACDNYGGMNSTLGGRTGDLVSSDSLIDSWTSRDWRDGVCVDRLLAHDRISVRTCNSLYELIVLEPHSAEVLVRGGAFFPEFTRVRVAGCSLGGSFLKVHGIYVGFRIELLTDERMIMTSSVENISISHGSPVPPQLM